MRQTRTLPVRLSAYAAVLAISVALLTGFLILRGPVRAGQGAGPVGRVHTPASAALTNVVTIVLACYCVLELFRTARSGGAILIGPRRRAHVTLQPGESVTLDHVRLPASQGVRVLVRLLGGPEQALRVVVALQGLDAGRRSFCDARTLEMDSSVWRRRECILRPERANGAEAKLTICLADAAAPVTAYVVWERTIVFDTARPATGHRRDATEQQSVNDGEGRNA